MSVTYIYHKGKKIMYIDYSNCKTAKDTLDVLEMVKNEYLKSNESFLTLNNFTGVPSNNEYMEMVKKYGKELFDGRTIRNAGLGITGIKKVLLSVYNITVTNKMKPFETRQEALEFLVKD
jgi:hypothetical protein